MDELRITPICGMKEILPNDCVADEITSVLLRQNNRPQPGDVLVVAHKIISKAENRLAFLKEVTPSPKAQEIAQRTGKDPRLVELILGETQEVLVSKRGALICRNHLGWVCADAGVDQSNTSDEGQAILLPVDPDASAQALSQALQEKWGISIPVIIADTHGRPLRNGIVGVTLGSFGLNPLRSYIGHQDRQHRTMTASIECIADELAGIASFLMGQGSEGIPAVLIQGCRIPFTPVTSQTLKRPKEKELLLSHGRNLQ